MVKQVEGLGRDLREQVASISERVHDLLTPEEWASTETVYLTGDGDSYHASCAVEMAFESIAGVSCEPLSALRFLEYGSPWLPPSGSRLPLVIGVSASGTTQRVAEAVESARQRGALTVAVTGADDGAVTQAAD